MSMYTEIMETPPTSNRKGYIIGAVVGFVIGAAIRKIRDRA